MPLPMDLKDSLNEVTLLITKEDVVFDVCFDSHYDYTYYGKNINGIATVSTEGYDDMCMRGINISEYILSCFMLYDDEHTFLKNTFDVYRLDIQITRPGIITPIFKGIE